MDKFLSINDDVVIGTVPAAPAQGDVLAQADSGSLAIVLLPRPL